jgi:hypothetical protein
MPTLRVFARGIQHPAPVYLNGHQVATLGKSANDGTLSVYTFQVSGYPQNLLHVGNNTLKINSGLTGSNYDPYDDYEYCALSLYMP